MTRAEVFNIVKNIFIVTFKIDDAMISDATNSGEIKNWDSLNHIVLISAVEKELKIKFPLGELMELKSVGEIVSSSMMKID